MDAKSVVMRSLDTTGNKLMELCQIVDDEVFASFSKGSASMEWTIAHLMLLEDWSVNRVMRGREPRFDHVFREAFKGGRSVRGDDLRLLPPRYELQSMFVETRQDVLSFLHSFDNSRWLEKTPVDCRFPNLGSVWENLADDSWWHLGQLSSLDVFAGTTLTLTKPRFFSTDFDDVEKLKSIDEKS